MKPGDKVWVGRAWYGNQFIFEAVFVKETEYTILVKRGLYTTRVTKDGKYSKVCDTREEAIAFVEARLKRLVVAAEQALQSRRAKLAGFRKFPEESWRR